MLYDSTSLAYLNFSYNVGCMLIVASFMVFFTILGKIIIYIKVFVYAHAMISVNLGHQSWKAMNIRILLKNVVFIVSCQVNLT